MVVERARGGAAGEGGTAKEDTVAGAAQQQLATKIPMQARREDMVTGMVYQRNSKVQLRGGRIVSSLLFMLSTQRKATSSKSVWPSRRRVALALDR